MNVDELTREDDLTVTGSPQSTVLSPMRWTNIHMDIRYVTKTARAFEWVRREKAAFGSKFCVQRINLVYRYNRPARPHYALSCGSCETRMAGQGIADDVITIAR